LEQSADRAVKIEGHQGKPVGRENPFLSLLDFPGLEAFGADVDPFGYAFDEGFDFLQIGMEEPQGFADDLGTGAAFAFDHTASFIFIAREGAFSADFTRFWHFRSSLKNFLKLLANETSVYRK
jgi:hypothetical protein